MVDLSVSIGSLTLKNPVLTASGTFGYGTEYGAFFDVSQLGGIVTKTITLEPRTGNPMPRIAETPAGMLNSIGLANVGVDRFISEKLPALESLDTNVIVNIAGSTIEEYAQVSERLAGHPRVNGIEINVSCPNVERGGLAFGTDPNITKSITEGVRETTDKPIIVKLTPNVTDIVSVAQASVDGGADALSLINTLIGMAVDVKTRTPLIARKTAGLSGPAIKPVAVAKVYQVAKAVSVPLIGIGGIMTGEDAVEFLVVGASAVQVGTLNFVEPSGAVSVLEGMKQYCEMYGIVRITGLIGTLRE